MFARVVIDRKNQSVDTLFDYLIPAQFEEVLCVGDRVFVEFGFSKVLGYVVEINHETEYTGNIKPILEVLDFNENLTKEQVALALFLKEETNALLLSCFDTVLPSFLKGKYRKYITVHTYEGMDANLAMLLKGREKVLLSDELMQHYALVKKAMDQGLLVIDYEYYIYGKQFYTKYYLVGDKYEELTSADFKSNKRYDVYIYVRQNERVKIEDIQENVGASIHLIKDMVKLGILKEKAVLETKEEEVPKKKVLEKPYTFAEKEVVDKFKSFHKKPFLFYTNVDEFKIKFYLDLILENSKEKKAVMVVVPNVFMVYQYAQIFKKRVSGLRIAMFTSSVKPKEYYYQYIQAKNQNVDLILTTMVGIFTPVPKIGLFILEDEESQQYLNENNPKFLAHEVIKERSKHHQAKCMFVSKSPSIHTYYKSFLSEYYLLEHILKPTADVEVIDMNHAIQHKEKLFLSNRLEEQMVQTILHKKQVLLVLNRKAYQTKVICRSCYHVLSCPKCKVGLSYYKNKDEYRCDLCNYVAPPTPSCTICHENEFDGYGFGLERIEQYLQKTYPAWSILNVTTQKFSTKEEYSQMLVDIEENKYDVILGSNLSLKAFANNEIALVGLLDATSLLHSSDFQAGQHAYEWISTVVNLKNTKCILQAYGELHDAMKYALSMDYTGFYQAEMKFREMLSYAPVVQMNRLIISGEYKKMYHFANYFKKVFLRVLDEPKEVLGPVYHRNVEGIVLTLKHNQQEAVIKLLRDVMDRFKDDGLYISFEKYPVRYS